MSYSLNPNLPMVRKQATYLVIQESWTIRKVAKYFGYNPSTISKWCKHPLAGKGLDIPTKSSKPLSSPNALSKEKIEVIINKRIRSKRCGQVIHQELLREGFIVSLPSVQRTLNRSGLIKKRSKWKRPHDYTLRPEVNNTGDLVQIDTIHLLQPSGQKLYIYTLIDLYSRWAYAEVVERISANESVLFVHRAQNKSSFRFKMIQSDNGSEFSSWFTHGLKTININHRHSRVRRSNDNAHIERFNRTIQEECLDYIPNRLNKLSLAINGYLKYYNTQRLHMGINYQTPQEVLLRS